MCKEMYFIQNYILYGLFLDNNQKLNVVKFLDLVQMLIV